MAVYYNISLFRGLLCKRLFLANEVLQGCLLHVRGLCEAASCSTDGLGVGHSAISLVNLDRSQTLTLKQFMEAQKIHGDAALKKINALRDKIVSIVWESCAVRLQIFFCCVHFSFQNHQLFWVFCLDRENLRFENSKVLKKL